MEVLLRDPTYEPGTHGWLEASFTSGLSEVPIWFDWSFRTSWTVQRDESAGGFRQGDRDLQIFEQNSRLLSQELKQKDADSISCTAYLFVTVITFWYLLCKTRALTATIRVLSILSLTTIPIFSFTGIKKFLKISI